MRGRNQTHKQQGSVQVADVFGDHITIVFVSNFLIDGPEICYGVDVVCIGFQGRDCLVQSETKRANSALTRLALNFENG